MNDSKCGTRWRCLFAWLVATGAAATIFAWAAPALAIPLAMAPFDSWLTWLCAVVTAICSVWGWVVTSVVVLEALGRRSRSAPAPGVPDWARRVVLAVCGAAVLASAPPAMADERPSVLEGLPLPDRAEGGGFPELVARAIAETAPALPEPGRYLVRPGDSLWSIAGGRLGEPTSWPRIYELNRDLVGSDPDLIRPGQLLRLPDPQGEDIR